MTNLEELLPGLRQTPFRITSPSTIRYNCIAWSVKDIKEWWWPIEDGRCYWPAGIPREETIEAFEALFESLGFERHSTAGLDPGYEKLALFAFPNGFPTHASRQLPNGKWTSKLGKAEDIEHDLHALEGDVYGQVVRIFRRPAPS